MDRSVNQIILEIGELHERTDLAAVLAAVAARLATDQPAAAAPPSEDEMLDVRQAAKALGVSNSWLHHRKRLPFRRKVGGKVLYSQQGITRWLSRDHEEKK